MSTIAPKLSEFATKTYSLPCDRIGKQISKAITIRNKTDVHSKHPHTISVPFITVPKKAVEVVWLFQFPFLCVCVCVWCVWWGGTPSNTQLPSETRLLLF